MKKLSTKDVESKLNSFNYNQLEKPKINKGERGQMLELALGIPNSSDLQDLIDGELKTFTVGETIAVTQIKHCLSEIIDGGVSYEDSKVGKKLSQAIYVGFDRDNNFKKATTFNKKKFPVHYKHLEADFEYISKRIRELFDCKEQLRTLNGPNKLLQIRTKASKSKNGFYQPLLYKGHQLKDKYMAFYLRANFGKSIT
jgi:DNA mismatch repair protein MutH